MIGSELDAPGRPHPAASQGTRAQGSSPAQARTDEVLGGPKAAAELPVVLSCKEGKLLCALVQVHQVRAIPSARTQSGTGVHKERL